MNAFVKNLLAEVADILPDLHSHDKGLIGRLPVSAPSFPNDLDPVIRAEPWIPTLPVQDKEGIADVQI